MKVLYILIAFLIVSCIKETRSDSYTYIVNNTAHNISIMAYYNGNIEPSLSANIAPQEQKIINYNGGLGSTDIAGGFSYGAILGIMDSVLVIFDNKDSISHYNTQLIGGAKNFYTYDSARNLYNRNNYVHEIAEHSSKKVVHHFIYTFTEQDYLDAKQ
ncbi:MAG: hypothetical protein NT021_01035 [Sphingobacteriales bacterium]|nr:hypothetical protein [Sphingobacteriales bacterium]